jgi:hypothetical protein
MFSMRMRKVLWASIFAVPAAALAAAAVLLGTSSAPAQMPVDASSVAIRQHGHVVGEIYREGDQTDHYVEHWVLFPDYIYPSGVNQVETTLVPGHHAYANAADFLAHVPFEKGSRYVDVDCDDGVSIPGR